MWTVQRALAKDGVQLAGLRLDVMAPAIRAANRIAGRRVVITSGLEGNHMQGSKHFSGEALDFRRPDWPTFDDRASAQAFADQLAADLGARYDVVLESTHVHVEYDPPPRATA